jgi:hypothetical protein
MGVLDVMPTKHPEPVNERVGLFVSVELVIPLRIAGVQ